MSTEDYERGRADAARAIRHAAEAMIPGAEVPWVRPGVELNPVASEVRDWLYDWVADVAEHGEVPE
jgi:hypothetical protein